MVTPWTKYKETNAQACKLLYLSLANVKKIQEFPNSQI